MSFNGTSLWLSGYPWCLGGKPTGSGKKSATLEPNVGPPGTQRLEGMEPGPDEELMNSLGQILARMEEMRRAQVKENRLFLKALLDPPALWMTPVPCAPRLPAELSTPKVQYPSDLLAPEPRDPSGRPPSEPQEPSDVSTSEPQEPSEVSTSEPQEPSDVSTSEPWSRRRYGPPRSRSRRSRGPSGAVDDPCSPGPIGGRPTLARSRLHQSCTCFLVFTFFVEFRNPRLETKKNVK
ncbi:hypothetical protein EYF80_067535 [Liparis tanakae]|uniref:Uncharacterized protein n=1 Tax=Liparis tanakae TaxID=230148 RepID=A0A4Z2E0N4_9TELE|nr:hypothetical protein EYF80_067535 [Liparis tanakae]